MGCKTTQEVKVCTHHWIIKENNKARCIYCGEKRKFPTFLEALDSKGKKGTGGLAYEIKSQEYSIGRELKRLGI